jgi:hypothetical protein
MGFVCLAVQELHVRIPTATFLHRAICMRLPAVITTVSRSAAVPSPSLSTSVTLHTVVPNALATGVNDSMPAFVRRGAVVNMVKLALLLHARENVMLLSVSNGPADMFVAQLFWTKALESSTTVMTRFAAATVKLGGSFTATHKKQDKKRCQLELAAVC